MTSAPSHPGEGLRARSRAAEPAAVWVRYAPRGWPPPPVPWIDLASGDLALPRESAVAASAPAEPGGRGLPGLAGGPFDDVVWLPPVPAALAGECDRLAERLLAAGTPLLVQVFPGEEPPAAPATAIYDLSPVLLAAVSGDRGIPAEAGSPLSSLPADGLALWPLIAGLTDAADRIAAGLDELAAAGVAVVQPLVPRLGPGERRRLAEVAGEAAFDRLFHGPDPDERAFARAAAARGLAFLVPRPLPRPPLAGAGNRRLAGLLAVAGELWLRLGRPPSQGQGFLRSARWVDETGYDLVALTREGNLGVVDVIDAASRALIEEAAASGGEPELISELTSAYLADEEPEHET